MNGRSALTQGEPLTRGILAALLVPTGSNSSLLHSVASARLCRIQRYLSSLHPPQLHQTMCTHGHLIGGVCLRSHYVQHFLSARHHTQSRSNAVFNTIFQHYFSTLFFNTIASAIPPLALRRHSPHNHFCPHFRADTLCEKMRESTPVMAVGRKGCKACAVAHLINEML